jgi:N-acetylneuraminic acid mutarotase
MYKIKIRIVLILHFIICQNLFSQNWIQLSNFPGSKRDDGVAVYLNNKTYFGTGLQEGWSTTSDFYELDTKSLSWKTIPQMPVGGERQYACVFAYKNAFYVFGGDGNGGALNTLFKFNPNNNSWIQMNSKPGNGLSGASCIAFGDSIIIVGGRNNTAQPTNNEVWLYTISNNTWTRRGNCPFGGRWRGSATVLNNKGYFMFGLDLNDAYRKELLKYDLQTDTWSFVNNFPQQNGRSYSAMLTASQQLVVFGGKDSLNNYYNDTWYYNDVTNVWIQDNPLPSFARKGGMCCSDGLNIYYSCGINKSDTRLNETWMTDIPLNINSEKIKTSSFKIFPNPARSAIYLIINHAQFTKFTYRILNTSGIEIAAITKIESAETEIDLSNFSSGIYFLEIKNENGLIEIQKVIKE